MRLESCDTTDKIAEVLPLLRNDRLETHEMCLVTRVLDSKSDDRNPWIRYVAWHTSQGDVLRENYPRDVCRVLWLATWNFLEFDVVPHINVVASVYVRVDIVCALAQDWDQGLLPTRCVRNTGIIEHLYQQLSCMIQACSVKLNFGRHSLHRCAASDPPSWRCWRRRWLELRRSWSASTVAGIRSQQSVALRPPWGGSMSYTAYTQVPSSGRTIPVATCDANVIRISSMTGAYDTPVTSS